MYNRVRHGTSERTIREVYTESVHPIMQTLNKNRYITSLRMSDSGMFRQAGVGEGVERKAHLSP